MNVFFQIPTVTFFMKVKREMSSGDRRKDDEALSGSSVHNINRTGRSWNRAENRLDRNSRLSKRESPRKVRHQHIKSQKVRKLHLITEGSQ